MDTDPQCNLTGIVLGFKGPTELEDFYTDHPQQNLYTGRAPAFEPRPVPISAVECVEVTDCPGMFLLPGNIALTEYETNLGIEPLCAANVYSYSRRPSSQDSLRSRASAVAPTACSLEET